MALEKLENTVIAAEKKTAERRQAMDITVADNWIKIALLRMV